MTRNKEIDYLRFIGLALIILAHVNPPGAIFQMRNFDVPLMVIVSAMSYVAAYKPVTNYAGYVWSRFVRLVIPTWLFLTAYFAGLALLYPSSPELTRATMLDSYTLMDGIGYIWIIRVFLVVALAAPFIFKLHKRIKSTPAYFAILAAAYLMYEVALILFKEDTPHGNLSVLLENSVFYLVPFGIVFAYGLRIEAMSKKEHAVSILINAAVFIAYAALLYNTEGKFIQTQEFKYPPTAYYLSYALLAIELLWLVKNYIWKLFELVKPINTTILFIANHSLWIYFWHIPIIKYVHINFVAEYVLAFTVATVAVAAQSKIVTNLVLPRCRSERVKRTIKSVLIG